ncbi:inositol monophosphatase family protein [Jiella mangrovi]|uniref:Inositol monophosphatase n=1 Tax=Jiella mangrovi TaxID=2821407 RepID=A0ABS4BBS8_9HYPH|nr:inositol monophosphatase [Jiella mangrovi]MBP0614202.1 inositol monophosphatase [Jiella mangrovi]
MKEFAASLDDDLVLLRDAARRAGEIALGYFRKDPQVWYKHGNSPVSEADYAADRCLKEILGGARPGYGWVSEEMPAEEREAELRHRVFVVDPIDGTRAFLRGEEFWCVSVAVLERGVPVAGVVYVPSRGETFEATATGPALLNGKPCSVSGAPGNTPIRLSLPDSILRRIAAADRSVVDALPVIPSLAYRLALVASGRLDGTLIRPRANDWDVAAADLILERAGGLFEDVDGRRWRYGEDPSVHGVMVAGALGLSPRLRDIARNLAA